MSRRSSDSRPAIGWLSLLLISLLAGCVHVDTLAPALPPA